MLPSSLEILAFHDACLSESGWPHSPPRHAQGVWAWVEANHRNNSLLWAEEDLARRRDVADSEIAKNKRAIDGFNQARNDAMERIDEEVLVGLAVRSSAEARQHSETAGMMTDRLSIMALKIRAMREQTERADATPEHRASCQGKLERLLEQRDDLAACLDGLLADCRDGRAYFKIYRQFKMYNDPALNPCLYGKV